VKPRPSTPRQVERVALSLGFVLRRQKGSHRLYSRAQNERVVIPFHAGDIPTGTLRSIIASMKISIEDYNRLA
jgi:predicted RNA binding protein YcfA (HicA-like mRNA interferase family)